ncbi:MAG: methionyl-tRNA formyltransferase [Vicinamibacterales bacterium]
MTSNGLKVLFMGTPQFAVPTLDALLASRHTVVGVITQPDRPRGRGQKETAGPVKARALEAGLTVLQPDTLKAPDVLEAMRALGADIGVVAAFGKILSQTVLDIPRLGMINVHASLLPRWRGAAPIHRAVIAGDARTGVTIMRVVKALDAGAMLATVERPIGPADTSEDVEQDLAALGATLLVEVLDRLAVGPVEEIPQDESLVTYAHRLTKEDGVIDWARPAEAIHNQIRGLHPWPHAFAYLEGQRLILWRSTWSAESASAAPGTVLNAQGDSLSVATGAGTLHITELQAEGRRASGTREFLAGRKLVPGSRFTAQP